MTEERRYQEDEVAEIFEAAAADREPAPRSLSPAKGLTLAELQEIGREVGVAPERIADAATALDRRRSALPRRTDLGMPVSASRSVDLPRAPTDREWALLVGELRETFSARGQDRSSGELREWSNGNLHASIAPAEEGYRFRVRTVKGNAVALNRVGILALVMAVVMLMALALSGGLEEGLFIPLLFMMMGTGALASNAVRLPGWAREREAQMEYITARAQALIGPASAAEDGSGGTTDGSGG